MPGGKRTPQFISLYLGRPLAIIQHTASACAGPQAGMWRHMLALPCREGAPLVVDEGGDEGAGVIWLQFGPLHLRNTHIHTQAYAPTCTFASFISTLILRWRPPASSWILISIWWMWRGPQGVGWGVTTYTLCTLTHTHTKAHTTGEHRRPWFSQLQSAEALLGPDSWLLLSVPCSPCLTDAVMMLAVTGLSVNSLLCWW